MDAKDPPIVTKDAGVQAGGGDLAATAAAAAMAPSDRLMLAWARMSDKLADLMEVAMTAAKRDLNRDTGSCSKLIFPEMSAERKAHEDRMREMRELHEEALMMTKVVVTWWLDTSEPGCSEAFSAKRGTTVADFQKQINRESKYLAKKSPFKCGSDAKEAVFDWSAVEMVDFNHPRTAYTPLYRLESISDAHIVVRPAGAADNSKILFQKITDAEHGPPPAQPKHLANFMNYNHNA